MADVSVHLFAFLHVCLTAYNFFSINIRIGEKLIDNMQTSDSKSPDCCGRDGVPFSTVGSDIIRAMKCINLLCHI